MVFECMDVYRAGDQWLPLKNRKKPEKYIFLKNGSNYFDQIFLVYSAYFQKNKLTTCLGKYWFKNIKQIKNLVFEFYA